MNFKDSMPELKGKGLFIFSDPGGAKPLLSYIIINRLEKSAIIISDRSYDFYSDFNVDVLKWNKDDDIELKIKNTKPDYVFTSTSYTSDIELKFIKSSMMFGIPTFVFVDHYTSMIDRFIYKGEFLMPDKLFVIDEEAAHIATACGLTIPIFITGNFYHFFLNNWKPVVNKEAFFEELGIPKENKLLVFAPDPLSNINNVENSEFDEVYVWKKISYHLINLNNNSISIVIKMHPNQNIEYLYKNIGEHNIQVIICNEIHTNTLLYYSDIVIGMFSNILKEALIMKKRVIRCMIGFKEKDPFENGGVGEVAYEDNQLDQIFSTF